MTASPQHGGSTRFDDVHKQFRDLNELIAQARLEASRASAVRRRQIFEAFTPLCDRKMMVEGGEGLPVRFVFTDEEDVIEAADDAVQLLTEQEGWLPNTLLS